jgi:hypothetical protein
MDDQHTTPLRLAVELDAAGGRIAGAVEDERGGRHPFAGWLGLLTLLEAAHSRARSPEEQA